MFKKKIPRNKKKKKKNRKRRSSRRHLNSKEAGAKPPTPASTRQISSILKCKPSRSEPIRRRWVAPGSARCWENWATKELKLSTQTASNGLSSTKMLDPFSIGSAPAFAPPMFSPSPRFLSYVSSIPFTICLFSLQEKVSEAKWKLGLFLLFSSTKARVRVHLNSCDPEKKLWKSNENYWEFFFFRCFQ